MKRYLSIYLAAAAAAAGAHAALPSPESLKAAPFDLSLPPLEKLATPLICYQPGEVIARLALQSSPAWTQTLLRSVPLASSQRDIGKWDIGLAATKRFKKVFLTFRQGSRVIVRPLPDPSHIAGSGVEVEVDGLSVRFHLSLDLLFLETKSILEITPADGAMQGYPVKDLLDAVKNSSTKFSDSDHDYWMLQNADTDDSGSSLTGARSFLFLHLRGWGSKAYAVAEGELPLGQAAAPKLWRLLTMTRSESELTIQEPTPL